MTAQVNEEIAHFNFITIVAIINNNNNIINFYLLVYITVVIWKGI